MSPRREQRCAVSGCGQLRVSSRGYCIEHQQSIGGDSATPSTPKKTTARGTTPRATPKGSNNSATTRTSFDASPDQRVITRQLSARQAAAAVPPPTVTDSIDFPVQRIVTARASARNKGTTPRRSVSSSIGQSRNNKKSTSNGGDAGSGGSDDDNDDSADESYPQDSFDALEAQAQANHAAAIAATNRTAANAHANNGPVFAFALPIRGTAAVRDTSPAGTAEARQSARGNNSNSTSGNGAPLAAAIAAANGNTNSSVNVRASGTPTASARSRAAPSPSSKNGMVKAATIGTPKATSRGNNSGPTGTPAAAMPSGLPPHSITRNSSHSALIESTPSTNHSHNGSAASSWRAPRGTASPMLLDLAKMNLDNGGRDRWNYDLSDRTDNVAASFEVTKSGTFKRAGFTLNRDGMIMDGHISHDDHDHDGGESHDGLTERSMRASARHGRSGRTSARAIGANGVPTAAAAPSSLSLHHDSDEDNDTQVSFAVTPTHSLSHSVISAALTTPSLSSLPAKSLLSSTSGASVASGVPSLPLDTNAHGTPSRSRLNRAQSAPKTRSSIQGSPNGSDEKSESSDVTRPTTTAASTRTRRTPPSASSSSWLQLSAKDFITLGVLGRGSSGVVYKVFHAPTMQLLALKSISIVEQEKRRQLTKELQTLAYSNSPYLINFRGAYFDDGHIHMALEYMSGGSLQDLIERHGGMSEAALAYAYDSVTRGLAHLHAMKQVHRDIKPHNLLINHKAQVKISDFGILATLDDIEERRRHEELDTARSRTGRSVTQSSGYAMKDKADLCQTFIGTILYMSPERIMGESYSFGCDVWAMGLSLVTCALGRYAIPHTGHYELIVKIKDCDFLAQLPRDRYSDELRSFVSQCLELDPHKRPSAAALIDHPFLVKYRGRGAPPDFAHLSAIAAPPGASSDRTSSSSRTSAATASSSRDSRNDVNKVLDFLLHHPSLRATLPSSSQSQSSTTTTSATATASASLSMLSDDQLKTIASQMRMSVDELRTIWAHRNTRQGSK